MPEPHGDLGTWLSEPVRPLLPPPGAFERISKRARRRKVMRALLTSAAAGAVVATAVTVPHLVIPQFSQASGLSRSMRGGEPAPRPATHPAATAPAPTVSPAGPTASPPARPASVLAGLQVSSVTFVGQSTGWVIGQAGTPGTCGGPASNCTIIARTGNYGQAWRGVGAPAVGAPNGPHGVSQIRFLNASNGWVFGPELWATHDGGQTWRPIPTHGLRVIALEARGQRAFAVWARCGGIVGEVAGDCTGFSLYSTIAGSDQWVPVPGADGLNSPSASSVLLVLTGTRGYLLAPNGELLSGPVSSVTGWGPVTSNGLPMTAPCAPGPPLTGGEPTQALLAATGSGLVLACLGTPAGGRQAKTLYYSPDQGATWRRAGAAPQAGVALSLSGTLSGCAVLATDKGIQISSTPISSSAVSSAAGSSGWEAAGGPLPSGGFTYVGMTTANQGVAIPADQAQHALWITYDSGKTWTRAPV